ncbi:IclR family transcriptional regulator domain-containing protein, partial [Vibrio parahaemolyticus]
MLTDDGEEVTYIDKMESPKALRFAATIGHRRPLYCSSSGRVLLAYQPA